jgi:hypothetical protein
MRLKPDGSLDGLDHWKEPATSSAKTVEQMREELIEALLRLCPTMTRKTAAEYADAVL